MPYFYTNPSNLCYYEKIYTLFLTLLFILCFHAAKAQTQVIFYTTQGAFIVEMTDTLSPITSGNFVDLTKKGFYDGVIFHRVLTGFVIQGGDPTGTGSGGPGYSIPDEFHVDLSNVQGTISMANAGPNTGGSQFFINLVNNTRLDFNKPPLTSQHPVFGFVLHNFNVVQAIAAVPVNGDGRPNTPVVMDSVRIFFDPAAGIDDKKLISPVDIFPNPITSESQLSWESNTRKQVNFSIFDNTGKRVSLQTRILENGPNQFSIQEMFEHSPTPGVYVMAIFDGKNVYHEKLIIGE